MNNIRAENDSLEAVNLALIEKMQQQETKIHRLGQTIADKDELLTAKTEALNKAEQVIRKMNTEVENAKRNNDFNERQMKLLKE